MKRNQSGFTLIEIAIVLVIIGLLLGGVLKGQELINSAKVKNLATDFKNVPVYIYGYQDKFRALPGDDIGAVTHVGAAATQIPTVGAATSGNGLIDGGTGYWDSTAVADEAQLFWVDVRLANLAPGPSAVGTLVNGVPDFLPNNAVGGVIGVISTSAFNAANPLVLPVINGSYIVCSSAIMGRYAKQLDIQMDDGVYTTGSLRILSYSAARASALTIPAVVDDNQTYVVCMGI